MLDLREEPATDLREHASIPSSFETHSVFDVNRGSGRFELAERVREAPFRKDYDALEDPLGWPAALRATESVLISAYSRSLRVGGIIVAVAAPGLVAWTLEPRVAVLWDVRVHPTARRQSIATSLLRAAESWALRHACNQLMVETQNTNPAACKFYMRNGFALHDARWNAYPGLPGEVQLLWRKALDG